MGQAKQRGTTQERKQAAIELAKQHRAYLKGLDAIAEMQEIKNAEVGKQMIVSHLYHTEKENLTRKQRERTMSAS